MYQTVTVKIKLLPTKEQAFILNVMGKEYISTINALVSEMAAEKKITKKATKDVPANLPSAVKNQAIKDAKSAFQKVKKAKYKIIPVLKNPICHTVRCRACGSSRWGPKSTTLLN